MAAWLVGIWIVAAVLMMPVSAAWAEPAKVSAMRSIAGMQVEGCSDHTKPIAVGGVDGFQSFANPANTAILRASCKVSLYIHDYIWTRLPGGDVTRRAILAAFKGTGPAVVELGASPDAKSYFGSYYRKTYLAMGVVAHVANVNGARHLSMAQWKAYVGGARADGLKIVAPVFAPNVNRMWHDGVIDAHVWGAIKARALIGGGLTVDAPPSFFFWYTPAYRRFIVHEIRWTKRNKLLSTLIISPNTARHRFLADTQSMIGYLKARDALPDHYVVENYEPLPVPKHFINLVGSEANGDSVAGIALWMTTLFSARP